MNKLLIAFASLELGVLLMNTVPYAREKETGLSTSCRSFTRPLQWEYCVSSMENVKPGHVLYYFHGRGGNSHTWEKDLKPIRDRWRSTGAAAPVVVCVSFGERFLLAPKNSLAQSGLLEVFLDRVMPEIESNLKTPVRERSVMGLSMGGYSAAQVLFRKPGLFKRGILVQPAITPVSPYGPQDEIDRYVKLTRKRTVNLKNAVRYYLLQSDFARINVNIIFETSMLYYPDRKTWEEASPLRLITTLKGKELPGLYISCGDKDEFGLYEGSKKLAEAAGRQGLQVVWHPDKGNHTAIDIPAIADFIVKK